MNYFFYLEFGFRRQTDDDKQEDGYQVDVETGPIVDPEGYAPRTNNHEENCSRTDDSSDHQQNLNVIKCI